MGDYLQSYSIMIIETICMFLFFDAFLRRKKQVWYVRKAVISGAVIMGCILCTFLTKYFWLKELAVILFFGIVAILLYEEPVWKNVLVSTMFQGILMLIDYFTVLLDVKVLSGNGEDIEKSQFFLILLARAILFLVVLLIGYYYSEKDMAIIREQDWLKIMILPVLSVCVIAGLVFDIQHGSKGSPYRIYWMFGIGLLAMNLMVYFFLRDMFFRENRIYESRLLMKQAEDRLEMYQSLVEQNQRQQALNHEYKNQIACLRMLSSEKDYQRMDAFLDEIQEGIRHSMDHIDTNHRIVNAILNDKYGEAVEKKIPFLVKINDLQGIWLSDHDTVVILSNLLNNAIEASERNVEQPFIKVKFVQEDDELVLSVVNRYYGVIKYYNEDILSSKKADGHGYGIKNIIETVKKYGGDYYISTENGTFSFLIVIEKGTG